MGRKPHIHPELHDEIVFEVCDRFLKGETADAIVASLKSVRQVDLSREQVYPTVRKGIGKFILLSPPREQKLAQQLAQRYEFDANRVHVVAARGGSANEHVAAAAADVVLNLGRELGKTKRTVHLALGAGWTTMRVARHLAQRLRGDPPGPSLVLHALSSALDPKDPMRSPVAFFSFFQDVGRVDFVGLFSAAAVDVRNYERDKGLPGVKEPFARRGDIDIVVTSLGDPNHEHGSLNRFLRLAPAKALEDLRKEHVVGELQCMPYSAAGPIRMRSGFRAVTLFEIPELVARAQTPGKYLVVAAGPCGKCGERKSPALYPLVKQPSLRVWTHLVTDIAHAEDLAAMASGGLGESDPGPRPQEGRAWVA